MLKLIDKKTWLDIFTERFEKLPDLHLYATCSSTMDQSKAILSEYNISQLDNNKKIVCISLEQTKGRGRNGRVWDSQNNGGIYLTITDTDVSSTDDLQGFSLAVSLAVHNTLSKYSIESQLKWPNDVLVFGKKICGILVETQKSNVQGKINVFTGIGLNYGQKTFDEKLNATSMILEARNLPSLERVAAELSFNTISVMDDFKKIGFAQFKKEWWKKSMMEGREIKNNEMEVSGICRGVSDQGFLLVETSSGLKEVFVGDVNFV